jgi:diguanylate cyclase (GGDEF)-like protein
MGYPGFQVCYRTFALALIFCALLTSTARADSLPKNLQFIRLLTEQGFSVSSMEAIFQDKQGYMWFGGLDGLVQYDGYNFISYRNKSVDKKSLSSNVVWDIFEDHQGVLWIATDGGLNRFDRDQGNFSHIRHDPANPASLCSDLTRSIAEDGQGNLWVATFNGLAKLDSSRTVSGCFRHDNANDNSLSSNELRKVYLDHLGHMWIGTDKTGLNMMNQEGVFHRYPFETPDSSSGTGHKNVWSIFEDRDHYLWLGSDGGGLTRLSPDRKHFEHFVHSPDNPDGLSHNSVMDITSDIDGNLWLATEGGLNHLDRKQLIFTHYKHNPAQRYSLSSNVLRSLYLDSNHDLWVGNFPTGVNYLDTSNMVFRTWRHDPNNPNSLSHPSVLTIEEAADGNLWLGTDGGGMNYFNRQTGQFTHYQHDPKDPESISANAVLAIKRDVDERLWLGTWRGGANLFDPATGKLKVYLPDPHKPGAISSDNIWSIFRDRENNLWFGTIGGGISRYIRETDSFVVYPLKQPGWTLYQDHQGEIWAGTGDGLGRYDPAQDKFNFYVHDPKNPHSLSFDVVLDFAEDKEKNLWIATRGGGLNKFDPATGKFSHFMEKDGLHSDVVTSLEPDNLGNFWMGSSSGLSRFNPVTRELMHYDEKNGLQGNQYNIGAVVKTRSGEMVVGGTDGFTIFDPAKIKLNQYVPRVAIVDFQIFNRPVVVGAEGSPLRKVISQTENITLDYRQSVFSFSFVAMSYRGLEKNKFAFMLDGFEKDWNYVNNDRRNATYTNLNAGTYVFKVKAANNQGVWNEEGRSITLHILPPPWKTWWAYTLYTLITLSALAAIVLAQYRKVLNQQKINRYLETTVAERTAELQQKHHELAEAYAQLETISLSDPLTGLSNRRYLQKVITMDIAKVEREISDAQHNRQPRKLSLDMTFFLLDVDFFKSVNDIYGHMAGDQVLIQLSALLSKICRQTDCLVRWGGEEFLIVSRFASREEAPLMAERIRKAVAAHEFACYPFLDGKPSELSWEQVVDVADRALYVAKRSGRNRTVGIMASATTPHENLYEKIQYNLKEMITRRDLIAVVQTDDPLNWD